MNQNLVLPESAITASANQAGRWRLDFTLEWPGLSYLVTDHPALSSNLSMHYSDHGDMF